MAHPHACKQKESPSAPESRAGALYVHVPFCLAKCGYCDFYSIPVQPDLATRCVDALAAELRTQKEFLKEPLASIFVGGGTPTSIGAEPLRRLLLPLSRHADARTEFTVEANPGTVDPAVAAAMAQAGVNRISLGVQSFQTEELALLGRIHTPHQADQTIAMLRSAGLDHLSVDLIYGIPGQSLSSWLESLRRAVELGVEHLSCYALSFEPDTPLGRRLKAGEIRQVDEQLQKDCYYAAIDAAEATGMEHYEISNFARSGRRCRHNITYWENEPYVGIGPAATGYIAGERRTNCPDLAAYLQAIEAGLPPPSTSEHLTGRAAMAEAVMLGLRLTEGIDRKAFAVRYGLDVADAFPRAISRYAQLGALVVTGSHLRLRRSALFVADTVLAEVLAEA
jgi:oxygen-independent coproporphyrinogen-3 oxidase